MVREHEYTFSVNSFKEPIVKKEQRAIALLLVRLILLNPGSDPLHPDMGVGIQRYRYTMNTLPELKKRVEEQINTYLPMFSSAKVELVLTPDKMCNIEISFNDTIYIYDSHDCPVPIKIEDLKE